jgi:hypothetical protein
MNKKTAHIPREGFSRLVDEIQIVIALGDVGRAEPAVCLDIGFRPVEIITIKV